MVKQSEFVMRQACPETRQTSWCDAGANLNSRFLPNIAVFLKLTATLRDHHPPVLRQVILE